MKRKLFIITTDSVIDLITNSSSELFVLNGESKEIVQEMIRNVYPGYLNEYQDVMSIEELSNNEIEHYCSYHFNRWSNNQQRRVNGVIPGFTFEEMYEESRWQSPHSKEKEYWMKSNFITDDNRQKALDGIDPGRKMFFLWSLDENPDWNFQEKLMEIGERYHLG